MNVYGSPKKNDKVAFLAGTKLLPKVKKEWSSMYKKLQQLLEAYEKKEDKSGENLCQWMVDWEELKNQVLRANYFRAKRDDYDKLTNDVEDKWVCQKEKLC